MFCANCGNNLSAGAAFCGECGHSMAGPAEEVVPPRSTRLPDGARMALLAVGAAVVVGLGVFGLLHKTLRDEPALALENYVNTLREKRYEDALALMTPEMAAKLQSTTPEKRDMALAGSLKKMSKAYCGDAGVESFSTATASQTGDQAEVVTTYKCVDGNTASDAANPTTMMLSQGRWLVSQSH